jgi:hypothetical protein
MFGLDATYMTVKHEDSGHGWLAVSRSMLKESGVADKISNCSYQKGNTVYLEEDCDMAIFVEALARKGMKVGYGVEHTDGDSPIRGYDRYAA